MKYLEAFEDFSKGYLIKEGRLSIKNDEMNKLNQIVEKVAEMVENGQKLNENDIFVDSLKFDLPNLTNKARAMTVTEYVNSDIRTIDDWNFQGKDVNKYLDTKITQVKKEKGVDIIYNDKINIFTTNDNKGFLRIYLGWPFNENHSAEYENSNHNDDGSCKGMADWTNGIIRFNKIFLDEKKNYKNFREIIRTLLFHEFIHAKDPSQFYGGNKGYGSEEDKYYGSFLEFLSFTGQFQEILINKTKKIINSQDFYDLKWPSSRFLQRMFQSILNFFAKGAEPTIQLIAFYSLSPEDLPKFAKGEKFTKLIQNELEEALNSILAVKKFNPKMWNNFLGDLYSTIQEVVDLVNNKIEEITSIKKLDKQAAIDNKFVKIKVSGTGTYKF